jgi:prevent-host-death family protein
MSSKALPVWHLHDAKARFSELFRRTRDAGPQRVLRRGGESVVMVPVEEFDRMAERATQPVSLVEFFRAAPTGGKPIELTRKRDTTRTLKW